MRIRLLVAVWWVLFSSSFAFVGCSRDQTAQGTSPLTASTPTAARTAAVASDAESHSSGALLATAAASTSATTAAAASPKLLRLAKIALDTKNPSWRQPGNFFYIVGAGFLVPKDWTISKPGSPPTAMSSNGKNRMGGVAVGRHDDMTTKLDQTAANLGLAECRWSEGVRVNLGYVRYPAKVYDGLCQHRGTWFRAAAAKFHLYGDITYALALSAWDLKGGDRETAFNTLRALQPRITPLTM